MQNNINPQLAVWSAFAAFTGVVLIVNAVQASLGHAALAWWHYPTLGGSLLFVWMELPDRYKACAVIRTRQWRRQAAKCILLTIRTARGLAVLNIKFKYNGKRYCNSCAAGDSRRSRPALRKQQG